MSDKEDTKKPAEEETQTNANKSRKRKLEEQEPEKDVEVKPKVAKYDKARLIMMREKMLPVVTPRTMVSASNAVVIDVEATGLDVDTTEMVQLAAVILKSGDRFDKYIYPANSEFSPSAASMTGMSKSAGKLYRHGTVLETVSTQEAVDAFLEWLKTHTSGQAVLFSHSCRILDAILLCKAVMESEKDEEFKEAVVAFGDTFPAFKEALPYYPGRKLSLKAIYQRTFKRDFSAHDAMSDASALREVMQSVFSDRHWGNHGMLRRHCFTVADYMAKLK